MTLQQNGDLNINFYPFIFPTTPLLLIAAEVRREATYLHVIRS